MVSTLVLQNGERHNFDLDFPPEWAPLFAAARTYTLESMEKLPSGHIEFKLRNAQRVTVPAPNEAQGTALGAMFNLLRAQKCDTVIVPEAPKEPASPPPEEPLDELLSPSPPAASGESSEPPPDASTGDETPPAPEPTPPSEPEPPHHPAPPPTKKKGLLRR